MQPVLIGGYPAGGLVTDKKPLMLPNEAFSRLDNAFVFRDRTKKREGTAGVGRLRRFFNAESLGMASASPWTFNIYSSLTPPIVPEANSQIDPGSVTITIASVAAPFLDQGNGTLVSATPGNSGKINYLTGDVTLIYTGIGGATDINFGYFPSLPAVGICRQDTTNVGIDNTIYFDTRYAYQYTGGGFQELVPGTTWSGGSRDFFWACNFQGATPDLRYFFATNNHIDIVGTSYDPIRYYNNSSWVDLQPLITSTLTLYQSLIIVPYYGRLVCLNTWEGTTAGTYLTATNFYARARYSQIGDPTDQTNGWRQDIFGRGGFIDAPTNESIVGAAFFRNTLLVFFEYSTWQLRYIGEYGVPFIFERISSDFGSVSTYSAIIFDQGVMTVSDRGIIQAGVGGVKRLDDQIPDTVFGFEIEDKGPNFVHGARDFKKEVVYWNYLDRAQGEETQSFPNQVLLFNYRNGTWAKFRDSITCFGVAQFNFGVTWDSFTVTWDDPDQSWDSVSDQDFDEYIVSGNQQGYISIYENGNASTPIPSILMFAPSLSITAVNFGVSPAQFTVPNHNLENGELIYLTGTLWDGDSPGINNKIYNITIVNQNVITLGVWNRNTQNYFAFSSDSTATYIGGGEITLLPRMNLMGKDFSPYQAAGKGYKLSYIDFQVDSSQMFPAIPAVTVQLFIDSYLGSQGNLLTGNQELLNSPQAGYYISGATQENPCNVESINHSLQPGAQVVIENVEGMTELNGGIYTISVVDADHFTLHGIDSTGFGTYTGGGIWNTTPRDGQSYIPGSQYAWYRFYSTQFGQYLRIGITYDEDLMNEISTHQSNFELNAMNCWFREGGRLVA